MIGTYDRVMLTRYFGFYMHDDARIRWDASASAPIYGVRFAKHRRPRSQPGRRILAAPDFYLMIDSDAQGFELGHTRIQQPEDRQPYIHYVAAWSVLIGDLLTRHALAITERGLQGRFLTWPDGRTLNLAGYTPEETYLILCELVGQEAWV